ncbi:MAG: hypothetical protein QG673_2055, partial [Pseudomonadota bacterium]|nr:hypothetical protein [Pseudomonadota bacterium]
HLPEQLQIPSIQKAVEVMEHMNFTDEERESYESRLKWMRDEEMALRKAARQGKEEGLAEGMEKGLEKGLVEGMEKGLVEGMEKEQQKIASKMLAAGMDVTHVADFTGLSVEQIDTLRCSNKERIS